MLLSVGAQRVNSSASLSIVLRSLTIELWNLITSRKYKKGRPPEDYLLTRDFLVVLKR